MNMAIRVMICGLLFASVTVDAMYSMKRGMNSPKMLQPCQNELILNEHKKQISRICDELQDNSGLQEQLRLQLECKRTEFFGTGTPFANAFSINISSAYFTNARAYMPSVGEVPEWAQKIINEWISERTKAWLIIDVEEKKAQQLREELFDLCEKYAQDINKTQHNSGE